MNIRTRLHKIADDLADLLEEVVATTATRMAKPAAKKPRARALRLPPMPKAAPSEVDRVRARKALERAGFVRTK